MRLLGVALKATSYVIGYSFIGWLFFMPAIYGMVPIALFALYTFGLFALPLAHALTGAFGEKFEVEAYKKEMGLLR